MADSKISALTDGSPLTATDALAIARAGASLKVLGSGLPGYEIGYDQITTGVNITGTTEAGANTIITCAAHTFDGTPVICEFFSPQVAFPTASLGNSLGINLWEGATELGNLVFMRVDQISNQDFKSVYARYRFTPSAASHTYLLKAYASSTTGTPSIGAGAGGVGANVPAFVRFTKA